MSLFESVEADYRAGLDPYAGWRALMESRDDEVPTLEELLRRPAWHARAACRGMGTAAFFPERGADPARIAGAKQLCAGCPVAVECAAAAVDEQHGLWGGLSAKQRCRTIR